MIEIAKVIVILSKVYYITTINLYYLRFIYNSKFTLNKRINILILRLKINISI